jgi:hypothetical protein
LGFAFFGIGIGIEIDAGILHMTTKVVYTFSVGWVERSWLLGFANAWILIDATAPLKPAR